jgi:hypothetical protein
VLPTIALPRLLTLFLKLHLTRSRRRKKKRGVLRLAGLELEMLEDRVTPAALIQFVDPDPSPFDGFGTSVVALGNGNVAITAPQDNAGGTEAGAVYLFNGSTGALLSTLTGSHAYDQIGSGGITALTDASSNYVIKSPFWNNNLGAVTLANGASGISGTVTASNSLTGSTPGDDVGSGGVVALANGNYVVESADWSSATAANVGAVTFMSGSSPPTGPVAAANSLVGSTVGSFVGSGGVVALAGASDNFVVVSPDWSSSSAVNAGAVTWEPGNAGLTGPVSASNSLVGTSPGCFVGSSGVTALTYSKTAAGSANYVVDSPDWTNGAALDAGAVTLGNGVSGTTGAVNGANSLVGTVASSLVGSGGVVALSNVTPLASGNYVVASPVWSDGSATDAGAVTWGSGTAGITGPVTAANSLVGTVTDSLVGSGGVVALANTATPTQNYVVDSPEWSNGTLTNQGAVTWGNGGDGTSGPVSTANSLVGGNANSLVGAGGVVALSNGNYVVKSPYWNTATAADAGAVTFEYGTAAVADVVSPTNSLIGTTSGCYVGAGGVVALANGDYVVESPDWNNGTAINAGAVTWESGLAPTADIVSVLNSLVGTAPGSYVGSGGVTALSNSDFVVDSPAWSNGTTTNAGAVTWENGLSFVASSVSSANSLVGTTTGSLVGSGGVTALTGNTTPTLTNYLVDSPDWNNGTIVTAGAVTWGGPTGVTGDVTTANSAIGTVGTVSPKISVTLDKLFDTFVVSFVNGADQVLVGEQTSGFAPPVAGLSVNTSDPPSTSQPADTAISAAAAASSVNVSPTVGLFDPSTATWYLHRNTGATAFQYGAPGWIALVGDFTGDGQDTLVVVDPTTETWYISNNLSAGPPSFTPFQYGAPGWIPVVGDWNGSGKDGIGVVDPTTGTWYLRNEVSAGLPDAGIFQYGAAGWIPVVGNWTGTSGGADGIGVVDPTTATWYIRNTPTPGGVSDTPFQYGAPGWTPVVADWQESGHTGIGVYDGTGTFYLRNEVSAGNADAGQFFDGAGGWTPLGGQWTSSADVAQNLFAAGIGPGAAPLSNSVLQSTVQEALALLSSDGVNPALVQQLASANYLVGTLPPGVLGNTFVATNNVFISPDASGYGWYTDTSSQDPAFGPDGIAQPGSPAAGKEDLLTTVLHEMGHVVGQLDVNNNATAPDLMDAILPLGVRRIDVLDQVFASGTVV